MAWRMYDFKCENESCGNVFEELVQPDEVPVCPECQSPTKKLPPLTNTFGTIQAQTRTSKIHTAGGVHKKDHKSPKIWVPVSKG